jgi:hypothetical protein
MEAATPLRHPRVKVIGDVLAIDGLVVEDGCAVRLVREREQNGQDPVKTVLDAVSIGARVLDREQAAANAEFVKTEFERAAGELNLQFTDRAREVAEYFNQRVEAVFGPENGHLQRELEKLFSDGSSASVQNRVRELVQETLTRSREDLVKRFTASDGSNPLADFKAETVRALHVAGQRQHESQQALLRQMSELEKQLQALRLEKEKLEEVEAEREKGTAKGRSFEEQVAEAIDAIAVAQGDVAEAVGDVRGATGKTGDIVVAIGACSGPPRGRIVFEAKDRRLSRPGALAELDKAMADRDADFAVLVVPTEDEVPSKLQTLREYNGDKLVLAHDEVALALEVGYRLARARVLMKRSDTEVDAAAVHDLVERALAAMEDVRRVKSQLSGAKTNIDRAYEVVEQMAARVRGHLAEVDLLVLGEQEPAPDPAEDQMEL